MNVYLSDWRRVWKIGWKWHIESQYLVAEIYFNQNLTPGKIKEYMKFLKSKYEVDTCRTTLNYIIVVLGKYLQMAVAWSIHKGNLDGVEEDFAKFNKKFYQLVQDFSKVTGEEFLSGFEDEQSSSLKGIYNYLGAFQKFTKDEKMAVKGPCLDRWLLSSSN